MGSSCSTSDGAAVKTQQQGPASAHYQQQCRQFATIEVQTDVSAATHDLDRVHNGTLHAARLSDDVVGGGASSGGECLQPAMAVHGPAGTSSSMVGTKIPSPRHKEGEEAPFIQSRERRKSCRSLLKDMSETLKERTGQEHYLTTDEQQLLTETLILCRRLDGSPHMRRQRQLREAWKRLIAVAGDEMTTYVSDLLLDKYRHIAKLLYVGLDVRMQTKRFLEMISSSVECLDDPEQFVKHVTQLGVRHAQYDAPPKYFATLWTITRETLLWAVGKHPHIMSAPATAVSSGNVDSSTLSKSIRAPVHVRPIDPVDTLRAFDELSESMQSLMVRGMESAEGVALAHRTIERTTKVLIDTWQAANVQPEGEEPPLLSGSTVTQRDSAGIVSIGSPVTVAANSFSNHNPTASTSTQPPTFRPADASSQSSNVSSKPTTITIISPMAVTWREIGIQAASQRPPKERARLQSMFTQLSNRFEPFSASLLDIVRSRKVDAARAQSIAKELGARHAAFRLEPSDYEVFAETFIAALKARLGTRFNREVLVAWSRAWDFCVTWMIDGATAGQNDFRHRLAPRVCPLTIVFTDIESSTKLWESYPAAMGIAVDEHHKLIRSLIHDCTGYEVKTVGDSFVIAFGSLVDAVRFSLQLQLSLMVTDFGRDFFMIPDTQGLGPDEMWNPQALRVRVGINYCTDVNPRYDPVRRYWDYLGPGVNIAARVESKARGGQTLLTGPTLDALREDPRFVFAELPLSHECFRADANDTDDSPQRGLCTGPTLPETMSVERVGLMALKGVAVPVDLYSIAPKCLSSRWFAELVDDDPHSMNSANASMSLKGTSTGSSPLHTPHGSVRSFGIPNRSATGSVTDQPAGSGGAPVGSPAAGHPRSFSTFVPLS